VRQLHLGHVLCRDRELLVFGVRCREVCCQWCFSLPQLRYGLFCCRCVLHGVRKLHGKFLRRIDRLDELHGVRLWVGLGVRRCDVLVDIVVPRSHLQVRLSVLLVRVGEVQLRGLKRRVRQLRPRLILGSRLVGLLSMCRRAVLDGDRCIGMLTLRCRPIPGHERSHGLVLVPELLAGQVLGIGRSFKLHLLPCGTVRGRFECVGLRQLQRGPVLGIGVVLGMHLLPCGISAACYGRFQLFGVRCRYISASGHKRRFGYIFRGVWRVGLPERLRQ